MNNNDMLYDKISSDYAYLESIMSVFYDGTLSYEGVLPALDELRKKIVQTREYCASNNLLFDRIGEVIKYADEIMAAIHESKLNNEEVIPVLGELAMNMLGAQKCVAGTNEYLQTRIEDKEKVLTEALINTKSNTK